MTYIVEITSRHIESMLHSLLVPYTRSMETAVLEGDTALILTRLLRLGETPSIPSSSSQTHWRW